MTTYNKLAVAIGLVSGMMMASQAQAFDNVKWNWHGKVESKIKVKADIDPMIEDPGGLVMVENLQKQIGDVSSEAIVKDVTYGTTAGETTVETGSFAGAAAGAAAGAVATGGKHGGSAAGAVAGAGAIAGTYTITTDTDGIVNEDIVNLESLENAATSVGNNASIESDAMVNLHNEQYLAGSGMGSDRRHSFSPSSAEIDSLAKVENILNLSVDNAATSVGNNLSVTQDTYGIDTALIADNTQTSYATITATAKVKDITLGLAPAEGFEGPVISNTATSVGNNMSVSVGPVTP
ncbi:hypothetical protein [Cobetia amphilecti]|uniref:hypothetical protein n=1 Tax=Cobetia amphilecti TaxID=1055104 RepID=UPI002448301A|nr:hypothetical protein [Cobetia litoralis]MDH2423398.1 hypothetical protein [Cobetia litoralis]